MLYQLAGFGTLHFMVPKFVNWIINIGVLCLIFAGYLPTAWATIHGKEVAALLVILMVITVSTGC